MTEKHINGFFGFLVMISLAGQIQAQTFYYRPDPSPPSSIAFLEIGGPILFSANVLTQISGKTWLRVGATYFPSDDPSDQYYDNYNEGLPLFAIIGIARTTKSNGSGFEYGAGFILGDAAVDFEPFGGPGLTITFAYSYRSKKENGAYLGLSVNPVFSSSGAFVIPGLRFGINL